MNMIGHNSAHFGEALVGRVESVLPDDHETVFHYVPWHIGDYIAGTDGMGLEIEGAYMRFLSRLYRRGKPLPDDDLLMASTMGLTTRVWRRVKQVLIGFGKIIARNGGLTNARFERERAARAAEIKKRSDAATARWAKSAKKASGLAVATPLHSGCNANTTRMQSQTEPKKLSKINDPVLEVHMLSNNQYPITNKDITATSVPVAARGMLDDIDGLNGATVLMQTKIAKWMNPIMPRHQEAKTWLTGTVQLFGSDVVRDAFAAVEAKHASDDIVGSPIKLMTAICQQKSAELKSAKYGNPVATRPKNWHDEQDEIRAKLKAARAKNG